MIQSSRHRLLVALAFLSFISLGLPDAVLGVAWPAMRATFDQPVSRMGVLLACGVAGYLASSMLAGQAVRLLGVGRVLLFSTLLAAGALLGYALAPAWWLMLAFAVCLGFGSGAIDTAINAFAASRFSPRIVTWLHACYGVGATLGPVAMTIALTTDAGWRWGYASLAMALAGMAIAFALTLPLWRTPTEPAADQHAGESLAGARFFETLFRPMVVLQIALFFLYAGIEVTAGQWLFSILAESRGVPTARAGAAVATFWVALTIGRITFGQLAHRFDRTTLLRVGTLLAPPAAGLICWPASEPAAFAGAAILGFGLAPIFPLLISATPARVGERFAAQSIGFQVSAATIGIGTLPGLAGGIARSAGLEAIPIYLVGLTVGLLALHEVTIRCGNEPRTK